MKPRDTAQKVASTVGPSTTEFVVDYSKKPARIVATQRIVNEETGDVITVATSEFAPAISGIAPHWKIGDCVGVPLADYGNDSLAGHCLARANHEAYKAAMYRWPVFRRRANAEAIASGEPVRDRNNKIVKVSK